MRLSARFGQIADLFHRLFEPDSVGLLSFFEARAFSAFPLGEDASLLFRWKKAKRDFENAPFLAHAIGIKRFQFVAQHVRGCKAVRLGIFVTQCLQARLFDRNDANISGSGNETALSGPETAMFREPNGLRFFAATDRFEKLLFE